MIIHSKEEFQRRQDGKLLLKMGGADQFEDTFANIAHAYLQEKAIKLIHYLVGFETVEKNDEGTKAVGMFGFKVGDRFLYVPVFFSNGQIKPLELLYIKDEDLMVPLDEKWVDYLLKQETMELGDPSDDAQRNQMSRPDLSSFATPPNTGRYAMAWARPGGHLSGMDAFLKMQKLARTRSGSVVPKWLERFGSEAQTRLLTAMRKDAGFMRTVSEFVPMDALMAVCRRGAEAYVKRAAEGTKVTTKQTTQVISPEDAEDDPDLFRSLRPDEKKTVTEGKMVIRDIRPEESTSKLYDSQYTARYSNPVLSGVYKVIDGEGSLTECLVLLHPKSLRRLYASAAVTVLELSTGKWCTSESEDIWVRDSSIVDDYSKAHKQTEDVGSGKIGETYILLNARFESSSPFQVVAINKDSNGVFSYRVRGAGGGDYFGSRFGGTHLHGNLSSETACEDYSAKLILSPKHEGGLRHLGEGLSIPGNFRLLRLDRRENRTDPLRLGGPGALRLHMAAHRINELQISQAQGDYAVSVEDVPKSLMGKKAALQFLMNDMGLAGWKAAAVLDEVDEAVHSRFLVKVASGYLGALDGALIPDPQLGPSDGPAMYEQRFHEELQPLQSGGYPSLEPLETSESNIYKGPPGIEGAQMDTQMAMEAAGTGQQEVFDHALLGTLAKTTQTADLIQSYVPDLQTAVDKLGRTLFLLYSKPEDFKDLYGIAELAEGEDKLRNVFRGLGEVTLTLKSKESSRLNVL